MTQITEMPTFGQRPMTFKDLADARRTLMIARRSDLIPVLPAEARAEMQQIARAATIMIGAAVEHLIDTLDLFAGDPDLESNDLEDDFQFSARAQRGYGPGCQESDPAGGDIVDEPHDWNELEVDEGEYGHTRRYGLDQTRPISADNPEVA